MTSEQKNLKCHCYNSFWGNIMIPKTVQFTLKKTRLLRKLETFSLD